MTAASASPSRANPKFEYEGLPVPGLRRSDVEASRASTAEASTSRYGSWLVSSAMRPSGDRGSPAVCVAHCRKVISA